jgi:hypothetical protein
LIEPPKQPILSSHQEAFIYAFLIPPFLEQACRQELELP